MRALREIERIESRVLGAIRIVDATTAVPIERSLSVYAPGAILIRNRSGLYVIRDWEELATHASEFIAAPAAPAPGTRTLSLSVVDPLGEYLAVAAQIDLPRVSDPSQVESADSLFRPVVVSLYPSTSANVGANWAVLRVSLTESGSGDALGGALLRVRQNGAVLARGLTDWRGEAFVPVVGVPVTTFSEDSEAVVISEISVILDAAFNPASGSRTSMARVHAGHAPETPLLVDPGLLEDGFDSLPQTQLPLSIAARRSESVRLSIDLS